MKDLIISALILLALIATVALTEAGLLPTLTPGHWDAVATVFWSLLPFLLCILLGVVIKAVVRLVPIVVLVLESKAALNDALMWQARHAAKAQRTRKN